jgi:catechol 2,3-dioxygenase-like lactoylglutathione lyase family enzyme
MFPKLHSVVLYVRSIDASIAFYDKHFGYVARRFDGADIVGAKVTR